MRIKHTFVTLATAVAFVLTADAATLPATGSDTQTQQVVRPLLPAQDNYRVAVFQAGDYWEFSAILKKIRAQVSLDPHGKRITFPDELIHSPGWGLPSERYAGIARSLMNDDSVSMIVAFGSVASVALLQENNGNKPVFCIDIADPLEIGLINPSTGRPVASNFYVDYVPDRWIKSISLLDTLQHIKKIGTLSADSDAARTYSNIRELKTVGRDRGFRVVTYEKLDPAESVESCRKGLETLIAQGVDSVYVPAVNCFDPEHGDPASLYRYLSSHKIRTYAKDGEIPVSLGALIGISTLNYDSIAQYFSSLMFAHILRERQHTDITLPFEPRIFLNATTARALNISVPLNLLINIDGIYDNALPKIIPRE